MTTLKAASTRCPKRVSIANPALEYVSIIYTCKLSEYHVKRENRKRNTKSLQQGCAFENYFGLSEDAQIFAIQKTNETHNNLVSIKLYKHMPCHPTLPDCFKENIKDAISL